jgi:hypothetical protein
MSFREGKVALCLKGVCGVLSDGILARSNGNAKSPFVRGLG